MRELKFALADDAPTNHACLPERKTSRSAGLDLCTAIDVMIPPGTYAFVPTSLRLAEPLAEDEVLLVFARSSVFKKYGLFLTNGVGVIDADYPGQVLLSYVNMTGETAMIKAGTAVAQGILIKHILSTPVFAPVDTEAFAGLNRIGGHGSTDLPRTAEVETVPTTSEGAE